MGIKESKHYDTVKIIDVINEYTVLLEICDSISDGENLTQIKVILKGIRPYDLDDVHESVNSRNAICVLNSIKNTSIYAADITVFSHHSRGDNENEMGQCILYDKKNNTTINDWLITRGHVKPNNEWLNNRKDI